MWGFFPFTLMTLIMFAFAASNPAKAELYEYSYIANPRYDFMVRQAQTYMSDQFRFAQLRGYYAQTRQYDPMGDDTVRRLQNYAYRVENGDENEAKEALESYNALLEQHLANLQVVVFALTMSREQLKYGNPEFYRWLRDGLIKAVMRTGNGKSLSDAFNIITMAEETVIFNQLGLKHLSTTQGNEGYYDYNMHDVQDLRTGQKWTLFVNTTIPVMFLREQHKVDNAVPQLPRQ